MFHKFLETFWDAFTVPNQHKNIICQKVCFLEHLECEATGNCRLSKLERTLAKADLRILDELSYLSFNQRQSELLFRVISDRSEKSSTIVTTNLPFSNWAGPFENTTIQYKVFERIPHWLQLCEKAPVHSRDFSHGLVVLDYQLWLSRTANMVKSRCIQKNGRHTHYGKRKSCNSVSCLPNWGTERSASADLWMCPLAL